MKRSVCLLSLLLLCGCMKTSNGYIWAYCAHPRPHPVTTKRQAILAAREIWVCVHPHDEWEDEKIWPVNFIAERTGDVWYVANPLPEGYVGPTITVQLSAKDASLVDLNFTQ
jgi:hypothetical protein